jgi:xylan 1,4-beta-xylosidase
MSLTVAIVALLSVVTSSAESFPKFGCQTGFDTYQFCNTSLSIEERVKDLIGRLTLDEKPYLLVARESPLGNISRLGVPQYDWGANCVHGVQSRCGKGTDGQERCPTSFPNPNHLGASFNTSMWSNMARIIGIELRSLWRQGVGENHPPTQLPPLGLDCWSPNINVVRDPRWGRNAETPSEDPLVLSRFGVEISKALQNGKDPNYLQAVVTIKHFIANSLEGIWNGTGGDAQYPGTGLCPGGKCTRHNIDPNISFYDLASTYFPAFKASVQDGGALGFMCSYNAVNGVPSCANSFLLDQKLRKEWGFKGYVTGDSGAIQDIFDQHFYAPSMEDAVIEALTAGADIQSANWPKDQPWSTGGAFIKWIPKAVRAGNLSEDIVDQALARTLGLRFRLGLFDSPENQTMANYSPDIVGSPEHVQAAIEAAEQGLVLLKNKNNVLPIIGGKVAVIGPHGATRTNLLGNYYGQICPGLNAKGQENYYCVHTIVEQLAQLVTVFSAPGLYNVTSNDTRGFDLATKVATASDHIVLVLGLDTVTVEREGSDRHDIRLPDGQLALFDAMRKVGKPITVVLINGGTVSMSAIKEGANAIIEAWYPGMYGAQAIARAITGQTNRWGKLPVTIYKESFMDDFEMLDFDMSKAPGRTYRYFSGEPLWPFGFGLSYTTFELKLMSGEPIIISQDGGKATIQVQITNTGAPQGDNVIMAFFSPTSDVPSDTKASLLQRQLFDFKRISLQSMEAIIVSFNVTAETFHLFADNGDKVM